MSNRLAFLGVAFAAALTTFAGDEANSGKILQETWEKTYPVGESFTLSVQNNDGRIYIYGSDANELDITAVKRAFMNASNMRSRSSRLSARAN